MRKTKIVCTIGPASESPEMIRALLRAGMDVARLNFSHGTLDEHLNRINNLREAAAELGVNLALLLDIQDRRSGWAICRAAPLSWCLGRNTYSLWSPARAMSRGFTSITPI
jgi:hypothetical protein